MAAGMALWTTGTSQDEESMTAKVMIIFRYVAIFLLVFIHIDVVAGEEMMRQSELREQISALGKATDIILMLVPKNMNFYKDVSEETLPRVSCVYEIHGSDATNAKIISLLSGAIRFDNVIMLDDKRAGKVKYLRVGIIFKKGDDAVGEFYFSELVENGEVSGKFNRQRVRLRANVLNSIYALPSETDATLIMNNYQLPGNYGSPCVKYLER
jgi:hypothetical protein